MAKKFNTYKKHLLFLKRITWKINSEGLKVNRTHIQGHFCTIFRRSDNIAQKYILRIIKKSTDKT